MQVVGADDILGFLRDLTVFRRQKLGTHRRVHNVEERLSRRAGQLPCEIGDQIPHKRLRDGAVDAVHGHVVAVIGRPAERQLGKISRAHDDAAACIRDIHEHLRALARLCILISHVMHCRIMADIRKMNLHGMADVDGLYRHAERLGQGHGVAFRPHRRAEARHRHGDDITALPIQHVHRARTNKQRKRRIQTARNADDRGFRAGMREPAAQSRGLNPDDALRALFKFLLIGRNKRTLGKFWRRNVMHLRLKRNSQVIRRISGFGNIGFRFESFVRKAEHIEHGGLHTLVERRALREKSAVLRNHAVTGENHVRRRFRAARVGIHICADGARGLPGDKRTSVIRLADDLIACAEIDDDLRARCRMEQRGRRHHP